MVKKKTRKDWFIANVTISSIKELNVLRFLAKRNNCKLEVSLVQLGVDAVPIKILYNDETRLRAVLRAHQEFVRTKKRVA